MHFDGETEVRLAVLDAADEETHESRFERDEMYSRDASRGHRCY